MWEGASNFHTVFEQAPAWAHKPRSSLNLLPLGFLQIPSYWHDLSLTQFLAPILFLVFRG